MAAITCVCLIAIPTEKNKQNVGTLFGKRKMKECNQEMMKFDAFTYVCPLGHKRKWPPEDWEQTTSSFSSSHF